MALPAATQTVFDALPSGAIATPLVYTDQSNIVREVVHKNSNGLPRVKRQSTSLVAQGTEAEFTAYSGPAVRFYVTNIDQVFDLIDGIWVLDERGVSGSSDLTITPIVPTVSAPIGTSAGQVTPGNCYIIKQGIYTRVEGSYSYYRIDAGVTLTIPVNTFDDVIAICSTRTTKDDFYPIHIIQTSLNEFITDRDDAINVDTPFSFTIIGIKQ